MKKHRVSPVLVLHGGAASKMAPASKRALICESFNEILAQVSTALNQGLPAIEAVARAVTMLEDDPLFNAGKGSKIQSDGKIRMSASIMDGSRRRFAGCVNVERVKNPVILATKLLERPDRVLCGTGAARFARESGLSFASPFTEHQLAEFHRRKKGRSGTVGAVALDVDGHLAAATSTGGKGGEYPHRVSDSPTAAGNYAGPFGAVSATGTGEEIVEFAVASRLCAFLEAGVGLEASTQKILRPARKSGAQFGFIALDRHGEFQAVTTTPSLLWAAVNRTGQKQFFKR